MFKEEMTICGILHYRTVPRAPWKRYTLAEITAKLSASEALNKAAPDLLKSLKGSVDAWCELVAYFDPSWNPEEDSRIINFRKEVAKATDK